MINLREQLAIVDPKVGNTTFIAIDGHGGSGKSTLANMLEVTLGAEVIHIDDFAGLDNPRDWWSDIIEKVFAPIESGATSLSYQPASWGESHHPEPINQQPVTSIMILEGVSAARNEFKRYISLILYVDTPKEICLARGIKRDTASGENVAVVTETWKSWREEEEQYMEEHRPKERADVLVDGTRPFEDQIQ